jgi:hypothetical protein
MSESRAFEDADRELREWMRQYAFPKADIQSIANEAHRLYTAALAELQAECDKLREESQWIRTKLELPPDTPFVSGGGDTLAGAMHVVCDYAHGYLTYIAAYKCNDKQGEIARLTVALNEANARAAALAESTQQAVEQDDQEPVTEEWLRSVGFVKVDSGFRLNSEAAGKHHLRYTNVFCHDSEGWWANGLGIRPQKTRGDVRLLCRALGINLKE